MVASQRFDTIFSWMDEQHAIDLLYSNISELDNPGIKYIAATRLGACTSQISLEALVHSATGDRDCIFERITRRKSIEALGRRRNLSTLPTIYDALFSNDEQTIVNAVDSLISFGVPLNSQFQSVLLEMIANGSDVVKRICIQCFTRLEMVDQSGVIANQQNDLNKLVSGASFAYLIRVEGETDKLINLTSNLRDDSVIYRRSSVIDAGDAGDQSLLPYITKVPISMPLRAKSAFKITPKLMTKNQRTLIIQLLQDDPRKLDYVHDFSDPRTLSDICDLLMHRDEERQYFGAKHLINMPSNEILEALTFIWENHGSDYGVHYQVNCMVSQLGLKDLSYITRESLSEEAPQYAKSRIAAAWSCLNLGLSESRRELEELHMNCKWEPLRWTCSEVLRKI